jgi:rhodanese-related sulfurtransferase
VISYGTDAKAEFRIEPLAHGQRIELGDVVLEIRHTPGHTPESISVVVWEHASDPVPWAVLTGDALFIGDVGRPDLLTSVGVGAEELARQLYRSLHQQLLSLPDETRVFPAHGAGSACGKSMSDAVSSTIGEQRRWNYALQPMPEDAFVEVVTQGQSVAPLYFAYTADSNRRLRDLLDDAEPPVRLGVDDLERCLRENAIVIDGRSPETFASGHLRGSVNVGLDGRFAEYAGDVVRAGQPLVVVADAGRETEAKVRLARIGFDRVRGAVVDVERILAERPELASQGTRLAARDLAAWRDDEPGLQIVDVRNPGEQESGVVPGAIRIPLARLLDRLRDLDATAPTVVYCAAGYRSSIAASLLRSVGFTQVADLQGGHDAWADAGLPTVTAETARCRDGAVTTPPAPST